MNDNMKKVVKALRSGEYKQTKETLQDENGYCCFCERDGQSTQGGDGD